MTSDPSEPFRGRIALVSGANRGLGLAIASDLCALGSRVLVGARQAADAEASVDRLRAAGGHAEPLVIDVDDDASVSAAHDSIERDHGLLDILVNNAGIKLDHHPSPPSEASLDDVRATFETNVIGTIRVTQAMLELLLRSDRPRIVNVSSGLGSLTLATTSGHRFQGRPLLAYHTSKTALNMATVVFANEFRETPLRINAVDPGSLNTRMTQGRTTRDPSEGARPVIDCLRMDNDGPTGAFFNEKGPLPW